jgi:hypothetical protein
VQEIDPHFRGRWWTPALAAAIFFLNVYTAWPLFVTEYIRHMFSIEAAYIALTRYTMENWTQLTWFPLWNAGMPYQNAYQPGLPIASAMVARACGLSPALAYHVAIGLFYCLGPVGMFFLAYKLSGRRDVGLCAALFFSLLSPSAFLSSVIRHDLGSLWYARRFQALIFYGEGPNVSGLCLVPFALWGVHAVYSRLTAIRFTLAAAALGAVILLSWPAGVVLAAGVLAYLLARDFSEVKTRLWRLALLAIAAYLLVAPWDPPSTIRDNQRNSQMIGGPYHYTKAHILYFGLTIAATIVARLLLRRFHAAAFLQAAVYWTVFLGAVALSALWFHVALLPQPERFHLGMEMGMALLLAYAFLRATRENARVFYYALAVLLCLSFFQAKRYRRFSDRLTLPLNIADTVEYQTSRWLARNMPGERVFAAGSVAFWLNAWSDTPQVTGCCLPGMPNPMSWIVGYQVPSGDGAGEHDAEYALLWMRAFGAQAVSVGGPGTRDSYRDWARGNKFEGVLPKLREDGGDRIYRIPSRTASLAHVMNAADLVSRAPYNGVDVEPLRPYVRALEDPALPIAEWKWTDRATASIAATLAPGQLISVQETYSHGWHASVAGHAVRLWRDALGLMTIDAACTGACTVTLHFDGGPEAKTLRILSWVVALLLAGWAGLSLRPRPDETPVGVVL